MAHRIPATVNIPGLPAFFPTPGPPIPILSNGIGRYVCMLKRLTICYCKVGGSSRGLRKWMDTHLVDFAKKNPQVAIYVLRKPRRHPKFVGSFLNGNSRVVCLRKMSVKEVDSFAHRLLWMSGVKERKIARNWHTVHPSIQGYWHPFLNKPWPKLTVTDKPNFKTEQELMQRHIIQPPVVETEV